MKKILIMGAAIVLSDVFAATQTTKNQKLGAVGTCSACTVRHDRQLSEISIHCRSPVIPGLAPGTPSGLAIQSALTH